AQEVERYHHTRISGPKRVGQAIVRGQPRNADGDHRGKLAEGELGHEQRVRAEQGERQLDEVHPEDDREIGVGGRQLLRRDESNGVCKPGRRMTSTPMRPSTTAPIRLAVMRSPSTGSASRSAQAGAVNSSANTVASGRSRRLFAQRYCAPRWT